MRAGVLPATDGDGSPKHDKKKKDKKDKKKDKDKKRYVHLSACIGSRCMPARGRC